MQEFEHIFENIFENISENILENILENLLETILETNLEHVLDTEFDIKPDTKTLNETAEITFDSVQTLDTEMAFKTAISKTDNESTFGKKQYTDIETKLNSTIETVKSYSYHAVKSTESNLDSISTAKIENLDIENKLETEIRSRDESYCIFQFESVAKSKDEETSTHAESKKGPLSNLFCDKEVCDLTQNFVSSQVVLRGSFHQGSFRFGNNAGKQCVANCLIALVQSKITPVTQWDFTMLDNILTQGNNVYTWIHGYNDLLLVSDLPSQLDVNDILVNIELKDSYAAFIEMKGNLNIPGVLPLDQAIQESLIGTDGCFICMQGTTCLVIKQNNNLFLFDSHARNEHGLPACNGSSIVLYLQSVDHLYRHLIKFVNHNLSVQFEITGVVLTFPQTNTFDFSLVESNQYVDRHQDFSSHQNKGNTEVQQSECILSSSETVCERNCCAVAPCIGHRSESTGKVRLKSSTDIEFVNSEISQKFEFKPTDASLRRKLCSILNIPSKHVSKSGNYKFVKKMGKPKDTKSIVGDGNCLFRAISFAVSQRQEYYAIVRDTIVTHCLQNAEKFSKFIDSTVEEHVLCNRMSENNSWGTAVEILAVADLLKTDIYTFTGDKWVKYSAQQIEKDCVVSDEAIYIKHENNHYDVVISVLQDVEDEDRIDFISTERTRNRKRKINEVKMNNAEQLLTNEEECYGCNSTKKFKKDKMKACYKTTPEVRERKLRLDRDRYSKNSIFKQAKNDASKMRYLANRENVKRKLNDLYHFDNDFNEKLKKRSKSMYQCNKGYRLKKKEASINKYATEEAHRKSVKDASIRKYATNETHRQSVKAASMIKYASDEAHRQSVKKASTDKYRQDDVHKSKIVKQTKERRKKKKDELQDIENVIQKFKLESKKGPEFVCGCCLRLFFIRQIIEYDQQNYESKGEKIAELSKKCISNKYVHQCSVECKHACEYASTSRRSLWVCLTCHRKLLRGNMPAESHANSLDLDDIPTQLKTLNSLEQHLTALNIPFMKILGLPKGGQKGVHGPVVCVPSNIHKLTSVLPRSEDENKMLAVKLKRKIEYKGYEEYQYISTKKLEYALNYLKEHNIWYSDVKVAKQWLNPIPEEDENNECDENQTEEENNGCNEYKIKEKYTLSEEGESVNQKVLDQDCPIMQEGNEEESYIDDKLRGIQLNTCLQPSNIGQEILDQCFDEVFNISPAEGNKPVSVLMEDGVEAKSFPTLFPSGKNTFNEERDERLSLLRYFNMRLTSVDNRFAKDTSYIFFAQYLSELDQVISNVQISLRKQLPITSDGKQVTGSMLSNKDCLKDLLKKDEAVKYLKPVRGTPPYWQAAQKDIFAMIRQLGKPTFFCSFSSADFRWNEMLETVMKQQGDTRNIENLDWKEKCKILYSNPVTLARMFDHRFHTFLKEVILSDANPIGKVIDYFYRIEFQQRGSPHSHCLFWIKDAPIFGKDNTIDIVNFIDKYITCEIPDEKQDPELHEMVTTLHQHSKNHSKSCKKKGTVCRFNFPRPPSTQTFIAETKVVSDDTNEKREQAKQRLNKLWDCVLDKDFENLSVDKIFEQLYMTQDEFENICSVLAKRDTVILKRNSDEIYINHYNEHLLRAWNANMDIQYVLDEYSCVVYIISYISKAERELGLLLQQTRIEAAEGNLNAQQTMKKIGTSYLHHREVSAQEAVYRVTGLNLKECSRKVEFIPVGSNPCRMSIPLKEIKKVTNTPESGNKDQGSDDNYIWMTSIVDRYKVRPMNETFEDVCLAQLCSDYSVLAKSQIPQKINEQTTFKLGNNLGYIRRRTRTEPAVIRYPRFSIETAPEKYFQSMLQLFLPYRVEEQLKPTKYETYEEFYNHGSVKLRNDDHITNVRCIVENNKANYVKVDQTLEQAEKDLENIGYQEDAWAQLCPETEAQRLECEIEGTVATVIEDVSEEAIPDLNQNDTQTGLNLLTTAHFSKQEVIPLLQNMNSKQREVFYKIRRWCLQKANGDSVEPFHVFVTGGGGTGKSHLIKCLYYEMSRILSRVVDNPDDVSVLLTAPTGTAAFNISGMTIHCALSIYKNLSLDHSLLSEEKINTLRSKLESLQVIIIDEISMVNKKLLFFIHERLRQIKKMPEDSLFGGVSVIAVGDFYQLPPVKTKKSDKLYIDDPSNPMNLLWNDLFESVELNEIMRQKNKSEFAEILNRLRTRTKDIKIDKSDLSVLKSRITKGPENALHIYATNDEIKSHNNKMVMKLETEVKLLEAEDFQKLKASGQLVKTANNFTEKDLQLPSSLLLGVGARIMLIKNIDTEDGLVNGVLGTVMEIVQSTLQKLPQKIFVNFDNENVGKNAAAQKIISGKRCIAIEPSTEDVPKRNGSRKQYPLQLAWACTIHKVQGLTVDECVIDLNKCFSCGQAYVALSRVTSLDGLYIKDIEQNVLESKIYCDPDVANGLLKMKNYLQENVAHTVEDGLSFLYHNIEGLQNHIEDLRRNPVITGVDLICLTETWLQKESKYTCSLEEFRFEHISRSDAYKGNTELYASLKKMNHGGVGVFFKEGLIVEHVRVLQENLECIVLKISGFDVVIATVYRTQKYPLNIFMDNFRHFVESLLSSTEKIIILGDFNQNIMKGERTVLCFMEESGFRQCVTKPTTEGGTIIDHVYTRGISDVDVSVLPTYYSYHESILVKVKN